MANRFDAIDTMSNDIGSVLPNRFDFVTQKSGNRFDVIDAPQPKSQGILSRGFSALGGAFGAVGRALSVGQAATTGLIEKGLERTGFLQPTQTSGVINAIKEDKPNISLLRRIGVEKTKPDSVMGILLGNVQKSSGNYWMDVAKVLPSATIGTLADIFVDPLVFVSKLGVVAKATGKVGEVISKSAKSLAEEIPAVQKVGDMLGRAFITRYAQRQEFKDLDLQRKISESLVQEQTGKLVSDIIEKPAYIQRRAKQIIEGGITTDDELKAVAQPIRDELDRVGESISKLNPKLLDPRTFEANKGTYFPRLYTKYEFPTEDEMIKNFFGSKATSIPRDRFMARELTKEEALVKPELIKEAGLPAYKGLTQLKITETRQKFFKDVANIASDEAKPGWIQLDDSKLLGNLAGKFLPKAEYAALTKMRTAPTQMEKIYGEGLKLWKTFHTAYNPATVSRNDITNFLVLNPLGGVGPHRIDIYAKAMNEFMSDGNLYRMARNNGLEISTQQAAELKSQATRFYRENKGLVGKIFSKVEDFHKTVTNFYGNQDKFFKLANFIKGVTEDGMTPAEAMRRANFYLVDYSEVPEFIEWLRKSPFGVPFISFTYGVSKPLAKTLLERPDKLSAYYKILRGIQELNPLGETKQEIEQETGVLPDWIQDSTYLRLPFKDKYDRSQYVNLEYILPFNVLESKSILPSSPFLTILGSLLTNKDMFLQKEIWNSTDTGLEIAQKQAEYVLRQIVPSLAPFGYSFNKIESLIRGRPDINGYVREALPVMIDVLGGIKATPIDQTLEGQKRAYEKKKEIEELQSQLRSIMLNKTIFPEEKQRQSEQIQEKIQKVYQ